MRRKLIFAVVLVLAVMLSTAVTASAADEAYSIVRIKLSIGDPAELSVYLDGDYTVGADGPALERQQYTVKLQDGALNLYLGAEKIASGASIRLVRHAAASGRNNFIWMYNVRAQSLLGYDKFKYLGDMEFIIESGHITAVNHVYIEDYLYGVVPWEMSDAFPAEALKAQAVAARNYAETHMDSSKAYDMTDTSSHQVYNGYYPSKTNSIAAVNATARQVLTYDGNPIEAYFSASNGGYTDIPYHRWGSGADWAYYRFDEDPFDAANPSSLFETIIFPVAFSSYDEVTTADNVTGDPDKYKAIACIKQAIFDSGQLSGYPEVTGRDSFTLTGVTALEAQTHDVSATGSEDHSREPVGFANTCRDFIEAKGSFTVSVGETAGIAVTDVVVDMRYLDGSRASDGNAFKAFNADALTLFVVAPIGSGETATGYSISQKRYGQGIGLSQRGAEQRAKSVEQGGGAQLYDFILGFYYPETTLVTQGYTAPVLTSVPMPDHTNASLVSDLVNIRSGPATTYASLNRLPLGARLEIVQTNVAVTGNITWHKIYFAGQYAYVAATQGSSTYVQPDSPMARQPLTVSFVTNGGSPVSAGAYDHADSIGAPPASTRAGYSLAGWYLDAGLTAKAAFPYILTKNTTLYAKWAPETYSIAYNLGGGSVSNPASYTVESGAITLSNPVRNGYLFTGWTGTGLSAPTMTVTIPAGSSGNRVYTANWVACVCTVRFDAQGGSPVPDMQKGIFETIPSEPPTHRYGYGFAGWYNASGVRVSFPYTVLGDATLYARWAQQPQSNLLAGVALSAGSMNRAFAKTATSYKITIGENDASFTLTPYKEYDGAVMTINGKAVPGYTVSLANGKSASIKVKVTYLKKSKTYTFAVTRAKSSNNALSSLTVQGGVLSQPFDPNVLNYTLTLDQNTKSATIKATAAAGKAAKVSPASKKISLNNGQSKDVKITVKAQSGAKRTYTVRVVRAPSTNADLKSLKCSGLSPGFSAGQTLYTVVLPEGKSSVSISAKAAGYKAVVLIDGAKKSSKKITLANGQSAVVRVTVVSQAGSVKEYVITVLRQ